MLFRSSKIYLHSKISIAATSLDGLNGAFFSKTEYNERAFRGRSCPRSRQSEWGGCPLSTSFDPSSVPLQKPPTDEFKQVIVGFYYFREGRDLIAAIDRQIRENISLKNEYYIADALNIMIEQGANFTIAETGLWLDTGVPETVFSSNRYFLAHGNDNSSAAQKRASVTVIEPVFVAEDAIVENTVIGPYVSVASGAKIRNCVISNSIIAENTTIENQVLKDSLVGAKVRLSGKETTQIGRAHV